MDDKTKFNESNIANEVINPEPEEPETLPNPNFFWGEDEFNLENGDRYKGQYCCHKSGIIWREGNGTYMTKDKQVYRGKWENDQLLDSPESYVKFPTGEEFYGPIKNGKYSGEGTYILNNMLEITSHFENNKPIGEITLTDYEGNLWKGNAEKDQVILRRYNHLYESIPPDRGIGQLISITEKELTPASDYHWMTEEQPEYPKPTADEIFARSTKTLNDFDSDIKHWRSSTRSLIRNSTQDLQNDIFPAEKKSSVSVTLLKTFLSKAYRERSVPIPVFRPRINEIQKNIKDEEKSLQVEGGKEAQTEQTKQ